MTMLETGGNGGGNAELKEGRISGDSRIRVCLQNKV